MHIHPSILSADYANFARELESISTADAAHVDVMDNHFVPNLTFGLGLVESLLKVTDLPLDVHLMITDPERWAPAYAEAGAASVTFHLEASQEPIALARELRALGARSAIAIKPNTPVSEVIELLPEIDMLLIMTVEPGFGGQALIQSTLAKVAQARSEIRNSGLEIALQVDGGVTEDNIGELAKLGADVFVAGSAVFKNPDRNAQISELRALAKAHAS
jgi:ribulose-phosphate 3-epimerase